VAATLADILGDGASVDDGQPLLSAGLDSLGSVEFVASLGRKLGLALPATLVFDHPTVLAVCEYLSGRLSPPAAAVASEAPPAELAGDAALTAREVAAAGGSVRPGLVSIVAAASRGLAGPAGAEPRAPLGGDACLSDAVVRIPLQRWDVEHRRALRAGSPAAFGAFMRRVDEFDSGAFGVSAAEATAMDPQHRFLLESTGGSWQPRAH
jgi:acyl carrier protein